MLASRGSSTPVAFMVAMLVSCTDDSNNSAHISTRDPAGAAILEGATTFGALNVWVAMDVPELQIGSVDGPADYQFDGIRDALRLPNGAVVVADRSQTIRKFDSQGRHLRSFGGRGSAPGEFLSIRAMRFIDPDSLLVWDESAKEITYYSLSDGNVGRVVRLQNLDGFIAYFAGVLADGSFIVAPGEVASTYEGVQSGTYRRNVNYRRFDRYGNGGDTVLTVQGPEYQVVPHPSRSELADVLFGRNTLVSAAGRTVVSIDTDDLEFAFLDSRNGSQRLLRFEQEPRVVTTEALEARREEERKVMERFARTMTGATGRPALARDRVADLPFRSTMPAVDRLIVGPDGSLLIRLYVAATDTEQRWVALDSSGRATRGVVLPSSFNVLWIDESYVLAVLKDELDVERLELFSLRPQ